MFPLPLFFIILYKLIKINIGIVRKRVRVCVRDYTRYPVRMRMGQKFNTVEFGDGDGDRFFYGDVYGIAKPVPAPPRSHPYMKYIKCILE